MDDSTEETKLIRAIATRARRLYSTHGIKINTLDCSMDLVVAHECIPLRLQDLLAADDTDFAHDIGGITKNLNRDTFEIENCFLPRFAVRD